MPSNIEILKIHSIRPKVGPLTPDKPPFNTINRPWDLSRSIELEEIYILVDLELHSSHRMLVHAETMSTYNVFALSMDNIQRYYPWILTIDNIHG